MSNAQRLITVSGLPGCGKSTIAEGLASTLGTPVLSIDPIEAAMWRSGLAPAETGIAAYRVAEAVAAENLKQGLSIIIEAVNPVEESRAMWRALADEHNVLLKPIEVICSNEALHRQRIEARVRSIYGMPEIAWDRVVERKAEYQARTDDRLVLNSATNGPDELIQLATNYCRAARDCG